jgi:hypothetical protein
MASLGGPAAPIVIDDDEDAVPVRSPQVSPTYVAECANPSLHMNSLVCDDAPEGRDRLVFHDASADDDDVEPGRAPMERVAANGREYAALGATRGWRRMLGNTDICPFEWDGAGERWLGLAPFAAGTTWTTVERAYHAAKARVPPGEWDGVERLILEAIARAKFLACPARAAALVATRDADLFEWRDGALDPATYLEAIRDELAHAPRHGAPLSRRFV